MKVEFGELKRSYGEAKLFPENVDDLWHLKHLIAPGDLVFATTLRSLDGATDKLRPEKVEKRPVRLGVRVEKVEFHEYATRLRVGGTIEYGVDVASYHTFNLDPGHEVSVVKRWRAVDLERVERAVEATLHDVIHVLTVEEGEAELFRIRQYGPERVVTVTGGSGKRVDTDKRSVFFADALATLSEVTGPVVVAGPGFVKDDFVKFLKAKDADLGERVVTVETRRTGRGAVQDVIGQGVLERLVGDLQLSREVTRMEEVLRRIGSGDPVAYGRAEVADAVNFGAVEEVLVLDEDLRKPWVNRLLETAEQMNAKVVVLSSEFEPGQQLEALGGVAALLRFKIG
ncbi:mRNA surveillance protein pelota [Methanofollis formosanus]|uniref:Protein pelota homolog n=1 Tax=Methanofollis formosanus TaxID=299308 RepID=A0A8G0ZY56_9EURY|nr:mRNA surveillance protein pelota [Methanofollis formosanus]QYZ77991.1 mRNA surveillance protein pelota [Methanofollis formosanus]